MNTDEGGNSVLFQRSSIFVRAHIYRYAFLRLAPMCLQHFRVIFEFLGYNYSYNEDSLWTT